MPNGKSPGRVAAAAEVPVAERVGVGVVGEGGAHEAAGEAAREKGARQLAPALRYPIEAVMQALVPAPAGEALALPCYLRRNCLPGFVGRLRGFCGMSRQGQGPPTNTEELRRPPVCEAQLLLYQLACIVPVVGTADREGDRLAAWHERFVLSHTSIFHTPSRLPCGAPSVGSGVTAWRSARLSAILGCVS